MNVVRAYRVFDRHEGPASQDGDVTWHGTMEAVKGRLSELGSNELRSMYAVEECQIAADKQGVLDLLRGNPTISPLRRWHVTARGGLKTVEEQ